MKFRVLENTFEECFFNQFKTAKDKVNRNWRKSICPTVQIM